MSKKFDAKHLEKLDNPKRRSILPPDRTIEELNLQSGQVVADVGCGIGYFTVPLAKVVGSNGKVYAIDIEPLMLEETKKRVSEEQLNNVEFVLSTENNFKIPDNIADVVFTSTVYHELETPKNFLDECRRVLKEKGELFILDWNRVEEEMGPPLHIRKGIKEVENDLEQNDFVVEKLKYIGNSFYLIIAQVKKN